MTCPTCQRRNAEVTYKQGNLGQLARAAARSACPSQEILAEIEHAKAEVARARSVRDDHLAECGAEVGAR